MESEGKAASRQARRFVLWWLLADVAVGLIHLLNVTVVAALYRPTAMLSLTSETNLPTWYATLKLAVLAAGFALLAWVLSRRGQRRGWTLLLPAAIALYLSLDEFAQIHERLDRYASVSGLDYTGDWMLVAAPVFVFAIGAAAILTWAIWGDWWTGIRLLVGAFLYAAAAAGLELAQNFVDRGGALLGVLAVAEELGELVAVTIVLWVVAELLARYGLRIVMVGAGDERSRRT